MSVITADQEVAFLAASVPGASLVFRRHGIGFCCEGRRPLAEVCAERGVAVADVIAELESAADPMPDPAIMTPAALIDHLFVAHHAPARQAMHHITSMLEALDASHGADLPELAALRRTWDLLVVDLRTHFAKEEEILFPLVQTFGTAPAPALEALQADHDQHRQQLARLGAITNGYQAPPGACTTWQALCLALDSFDRDLERHIRIEEQNLFSTVKA